jgi:nucleoid-associated protein YgaU
MPNTRGELAPATIENLATGDKVYCMFNPHEYTLTKQNQWELGENKGKNIPKIKFKQGGAETLKLQLFFDTYGTQLAEDVRGHTQALWQMMMVSDEEKNQKNNKSEPPQVAFEWGQFKFEAVITNISQKFTLFDKDGVPLRTTVDVTFQQVKDDQNHHGQNPTSGGGPPIRTHVVQAGERLDLIAAKAYGDPSYWRLIAQRNKLAHPQRLREGQLLVIPALE